MMLSSLAASTTYRIFGDIKFINIFAMDHPLARALDKVGYVAGAIFDQKSI